MNAEKSLHHSAIRQVERFIRNACSLGLSSSFVVLQDAGVSSSLADLIGWSIRSCLKRVVRSSNKVYIGRISGLSTFSDQDALSQLAAQFSRRQGRSSPEMALEDLLDHFQQCRIDSVPSIILIDHFHHFAFRPRQVLLYTLLDWVHRSDCLLVLIGVTPCVSVHDLLEKRVASRLSSFIQCGPPSAEDVCRYFVARLSSSNGSDPTSHDEQISHLFGQFEFNSKCLTGQKGCRRDEDTPLSKKRSRLETKETHEKQEDTGDDREEDKAGEDEVEEEEELRLVRRGTMFEWVCEQLALGFDSNSAQRFISLLADKEQLNEKEILSAFSSMQMPSLRDSLLSLSRLNLYVLACVARIQCIADKSRTPRVVPRVSEVIEAFNRITDILRNKEVPLPRILKCLPELAELGLITLSNTPFRSQLRSHHLLKRSAQPNGQQGYACEIARLTALGRNGVDDAVTASTCVSLVSATAEVQNAFRAEIQVPPRVRKAVLEPFAPII